MSTAAHALREQELVLDRYRPVRPLGRGASGSVWLARDERTGLDVALKIVPREGKRASRAVREAQVATRLRHERCVRAYGFGEDAGHVYIAYEFVAGRTLRDRMRSCALTDAEAVETAAQVCEGLAHAHANGVVHRDVKPSNVLLADAEGVDARLLDFGLAQLEEFDTLTAVGDVPGTLAYISPERLGGGEATPASDVWAVGVMLWESLAGRHPFWGVPLPEVASAIEAGPPPLAQERRDLPRALVQVVERALAPDPGRRPRANELAHELRDALTHGARRRETERHASAPRPRRLAASPTLDRRLLPAALAGITAAVGGALLPFWPAWLLALIALAAAVTTLRAPRAGLAIALAAPVFPLGNVSAGAAFLYAGAAAAWVALSWRDPRSGLAFTAGPILAPFGLLALVPLAVQGVRGTALRALHAGVAVLAAALVAALSGERLPLVGGSSTSLGVEGSDSARAVADALLARLADTPGLVVAAIVLAASAAALPHAVGAGRWGIAFLGAAQTGLLLVAAPSAAALPVVAGTWLLCGILAARGAR